MDPEISATVHVMPPETAPKRSWSPIARYLVVLLLFAAIGFVVKLMAPLLRPQLASYALVGFVGVFGVGLLCCGVMFRREQKARAKAHTTRRVALVSTINEYERPATEALAQRLNKYFRRKHSRYLVPWFVAHTIPKYASVKDLDPVRKKLEGYEGVVCLGTAWGHGLEVGALGSVSMVFRFEKTQAMEAGTVVRREDFAKVRNLTPYGKAQSWIPAISLPVKVDSVVTMNSIVKESGLNQFVGDMESDFMAHLDPLWGIFRVVVDHGNNVTNTNQERCMELLTNHVFEWIRARYEGESYSPPVPQPPNPE